MLRVADVIVAFIGLCLGPSIGSAVNPLADPTPLDSDEEYLRPYLEDLLEYRDNPVARKYIFLANLVDWLPTWLEDWFIPLVFPGSSITLPIDATVPFPDMPGNVTLPVPLPESLTIDTLTVNDLNKFKKLQPAKLRKNSKFTWDGIIELKKTTITLETHMTVNGTIARATLVLPLAMLSLDFSVILAFDRTRLCEVWREVMLSSRHCALWPVASYEESGVSGLNVTDFRVSLADFDVLLTLHDIVGPIDAAALKLALELAVAVVKPLVLLALPGLISQSLRSLVNTAALHQIPEVQRTSPCRIDELAPTVNISQVCFNNNAAFQLKWMYHNCPAHVVSAETHGYPADVTECRDVKDLLPNVVEGQVVRVGTEAVKGFHELVDPAFRYVPDSNAGGFECHGSTLIYKCEFVSVAPLDINVLPPVRHVCVLNEAGYDMNFQAANLRTSTSASSRTYSVNHKQCVDLASASFSKEGDEFKININPNGGTKKTANRNVRYAQNNLNATFVCQGSSTIYDCKLLYVPLPPTASRICVVNHGAFSLSFDALDLRTQAWVGRTKFFPNPRTKCIELNGLSLDVEEGDEFEMHAKAGAGVKRIGDSKVKFSSSAGTATYKCWGSTRVYQCALQRDSGAHENALV